MNLQRHPDFDNHEKVVSIEDKATGLAAIICIHSVALGPAAGGCRKSTYADPDAALTDALRLSRGMSFKNALAGLPAGGGKAVIYRMDGPVPNDPGWRAFGDAVDALSGDYITAEDVGTTVANMEMVANRTRYVAGLPSRPGKAGGDPSPWTALGVFVSLQAAMGRALTGTRIAVQGLGAVGYKLCERLHRDGAKLIVADIDPSRTAQAHQDFGAEVAPIEGIHTVSADAFSPNALGAILNAETISTLNSPIICGGANNQLASAANGRDLLSRGITYVPDYVANAGGIINVMAEYLSEAADRVEAQVRAIGPRVASILEQARAECRPSNEISDHLARVLINKAAHRRAETARIRMTATGKST